MADPNDLIWYQTITLGFSDSEDRIWVRLTGGSPSGGDEARPDAMLWATRRLIANLLPSAFNLLAREHEQPAPAAPSAEKSDSASMARAIERHREQTRAAARREPTPAPERAVAGNPPRQMGLLATIDVKRGRSGMALVFRGAGQPVGFRCGLDQAHNLLQAFWDRQNRAGWAIRAPWDAVSSGPPELGVEADRPGETSGPSPVSSPAKHQGRRKGGSGAPPQGASD